MTDPRDRREVHFRVRWFRPRFQGGDTQHPLCRVPAIGWAGPEFAELRMSEDPVEVECLACRGALAVGGLSARLRRRARIDARVPAEEIAA